MIWLFWRRSTRDPYAKFSTNDLENKFLETYLRIISVNSLDVSSIERDLAQGRIVASYADRTRTFIHEAANRVLSARRMLDQLSHFKLNSTDEELRSWLIERMNPLVFDWEKESTTV